MDRVPRSATHTPVARPQPDLIPSACRQEANSQDLARPHVSVVVPVYNGEAFLVDTLEGIRGQTMGDFEVVCIDDASLDGSLAVLEDFASRDKRFKVLRRDRNGGSAPKCLIYALPYCNGDYFFYCSQDDLLSFDCLERAYERALESNADVVLPDMIRYSSAGDNREGIFPPQGDYDALLTGRQAFTLSLTWKIHCGGLKKMDLVKRVGYDDRFVNSDEYTARLFYLCSDRVGFSKGAFYYRQDNPDAITKRHSIKTFDWLGTHVRVLDLMEANDIDRRDVRSYALVMAGFLWRMRHLLRTMGNDLTPEERERAQGLVNAASMRLASLPLPDRLYLAVWAVRIRTSWFLRRSSRIQKILERHRHKHPRILMPDANAAALRFLDRWFFRRIPTRGRVDQASTPHRHGR